MANSSRKPDLVRRDAEQKGYSRILFQQGKPVCDFELTLLGDLANPQRMAEQYIGSGVPAGNDGFVIGKLDVAAGDFTIGAGRCLVNGKEVTLGADTTYRKQPHKPPEAAFPKGSVNIYLHVFPTEITELEDPDLRNKDDVGIVTAVREKTDWEVLVSSATLKATDNYLLATFNTKQSDNAGLVDRRRKELTVAALRDEFDALGGTASSLNDRLNASLNPDGTLKNNLVDNTRLADNAVTGDKIADGSVTNKELAANAVTKLQLAENAVTTNAILNESVTDKKLAVNAVNEANLVSNAVTNRTIQDGAVSLQKLGLTPVGKGTIDVPPAAIVNNVTIPGETVALLLNGEQHAFFLVSVVVVAPKTPGLSNRVHWIHRVVGGVGGPPGNKPFHQQQILLQNFTTTTKVTVDFQAFMIADT